LAYGFFTMTKVNLVNLTFQQLEALIAIVEEGTFSRAARRVHLTQPSLTKHIQNLEELVGVPLLLRGRGGVSLTAEGRLVFHFARKLMKVREETADRLSRLVNGEGVEIEVAASTIPSVYILPKLISLFRQGYPQSKIIVVSSDSAGVTEMVEEGEVALGLVGYKPSSGRLVAEVLGPDRLILVASPRLYPCQKEVHGFSELCKLPFIVRERGSGTQEMVEKWLREKARLNLHQLNVVACFGSSEAVKEAVLAGVGVSFLSHRAVTRELKLGLLREIPVEGDGIMRYFYLIYRRTQRFLSYEKSFLDFIRSTFGGGLVE